MNVVMLAPGYPTEIPRFVRGLTTMGARVLGVGDIPERELPALAREHLAAYLQVPSLLDEAGVVAAVRGWSAAGQVERVECLWEPGVLLAAKLREALGIPGLPVAAANRFRNKDLMKQAVAAAGIRTPKHASARTAKECRAAVETVGYPAILKPIAGAGSQDTYRVNNAAELGEAIRRMGKIDEVNVEEFIDGDEYTFDTICVNGEIKYFNIFWYRPRPLIARTEEWISPQTLALRDVEHPALAGGRAMGRAVIDALGFQSGFTHMEWYMKPDGEAVFGEIAARPPGAHSVDVMNFACDMDVYSGWAEAVVRGTFSQQVERKYNANIIFKRASGQGRIRHIEGLDRIARFREHIVAMELLPIGAPRRNWIQTLISDGFVIVRHPDLETCMDISDAIGRELQLHAG